MPNIGQIDRVGLHQRLHLIVVRGRDPRDTLHAGVPRLLERAAEAHHHRRRDRLEISHSHGSFLDAVLDVCLPDKRGPLVDAIRANLIHALPVWRLHEMERGLHCQGRVGNQDASHAERARMIHVCPQMAAGGHVQPHDGPKLIHGGHFGRAQQQLMAEGEERRVLADVDAPEAVEHLGPNDILRVLSEDLPAIRRRNRLAGQHFFGVARQHGERVFWRRIFAARPAWPQHLAPLSHAPPPQLGLRGEKRHLERRSTR
mmetsp:Transcript_16045/g.61185  ORF Transcript_16045/g.61185 Transcript_16045/m.61185 type:complete len:258 (+) Transcript_16045:318-1091(+)